MTTIFIARMFDSLPLVSTVSEEQNKQNITATKWLLQNYARSFDHAQKTFILTLRNKLPLSIQ